MTQPVDFDQELTEAARRAMAHAYAPYSRFAVGAAVRLTDGRILVGANMENASLGLSLCAEAVAIANANSFGQLREIVSIAVAGGPMSRDGKAHLSNLAPCGRCRQILIETAQLAGRDIHVYCADAAGERWAAYSAFELLPDAFSGTAFANETKDQESC